MNSKCTYPNCPRDGLFFMCWNNETGKHCGLVCNTHDTSIGRRNLMNLGMTKHEATLFERYLAETENDSNPPYWPMWFRAVTNSNPTELANFKAMPSDTPVTALTLSARAHNALRRNGILTVKQLLAANLLGMRNLGHTSVVEIRKALEAFSE